MSKNTYTLTPQNQLIDLNGNLVNFDLTFSATSKDGTPFKAVVIDQQTLDTNPEINYNIVENGSVGGNIVYDKNIPQNFFLIVKIHENPCEVEVLIDKKEIPGITTTQKNPTQETKILQSSSPSIWKVVLIVIAILLVGFLIWQQYNNWKDKKSGFTSKEPLTDSPLASSSNSGSNLGSKMATPDNPTFPSGVNHELLQRLNRLSTNFN
jgi:hypothetical protein